MEINAPKERKQIIRESGLDLEINKAFCVALILELRYAG